MTVEVPDPSESRDFTPGFFILLKHITQEIETDLFKKLKFDYSRERNQTENKNICLNPIVIYIIAYELL
jgi:hypothetical protein